MPYHNRITPTIIPAPRKVGRPPRAATLFRRLLGAGRPTRARFLTALARLAEEASQAERDARGEARLLRDISVALARAGALAARAKGRAGKGGAK